MVQRRLLARIHRYTIRTLRAEIEPVSSADFMRFLLDWQGVTSDPRPEGIESLAAVIAQLEGYEIPAAAWESDVLPARMHEYDPNWLDSLCQSGRALWARLTPAKGMTAAPVRSTPITLLTRKNWLLWQSLTEQPRDDMQLSHPAQALVEHLRSHGASFFDDIVGGTGLLRAQAEAALAEVVAAGLVNADSYSGLRALLIPSERRRRLAARRDARTLRTGGFRALDLMLRETPASAAESVERSPRSSPAATASCSVVLSSEGRMFAAVHSSARLSKPRGAGNDPGRTLRGGGDGEQYRSPMRDGLRVVRRRGQRATSWALPPPIRQPDRHRAPLPRVPALPKPRVFRYGVSRNHAAVSQISLLPMDPASKGSGGSPASQRLVSCQARTAV